MNFSNLSVLVVDDFSTMRRIVSNLLKQAGVARVSEADDGADALRKLENGHFNFVVSDWNMPLMNGLELLKVVRHLEQLKHLPFLLVTAEARKDNIIDAVHAGADGYIVKPFSGEVLREKIEGILKRRGIA
jgi:two-component system chemotaxis response regulator CheY